jgi:hypothetical protein
VNQAIVEAFEAQAIQFAPPTNVTYVPQANDQLLRLNMEHPHVENGQSRRKVYQRSHPQGLAR